MAEPKSDEWRGGGVGGAVEAVVGNHDREGFIPSCAPLPCIHFGHLPVYQRPYIMSNLATQQQEGEERPSGMSSSGSSASLTSESSFDPNDPETYSQPGSSSASKPAPLGIVEIARMARNDRKARKASRSPVQERGPILLLSPPVSPGVNSAMGMLGEGDVFARDVVIKGWKIVGGKGFGDKAKVGAYVGRFIQPASADLPVYDIELVTKSVCL